MPLQMVLALVWPDGDGGRSVDTRNSLSTHSWVRLLVVFLGPWTSACGPRFPSFAKICPAGPLKFHLTRVVCGECIVSFTVIHMFEAPRTLSWLPVCHILRPVRERRTTAWCALLGDRLGRKRWEICREEVGLICRARWHEGGSDTGFPQRMFVSPLRSRGERVRKNPRKGVCWSWVMGTGADFIVFFQLLCIFEIFHKKH